MPTARWPSLTSTCSSPARWCARSRRRSIAYWNSASAYPAASLIGAAPADSAAQVRDAWTKLNDNPAAARYVEALRSTPLVRQLVSGDLPFEWTRARVVSDDPAKVLDPPEREDLHMLPHLQQALGHPARELDLVSPYFVPSKEGTAALRALAAGGVQVRVLTNSLAATDVAPVHAGYAKYREDLLRGGVRLYELKPREDGSRDSGGGSGGSSGGSSDAEPACQDLRRGPQPDLRRLVQPRPALGTPEHRDGRRPRERHARDATVERARHRAAGQGLHRRAHGRRQARMERRPDAGRLEPGAGALRRLWIGFLSILPIEWML